MAYLVRYSATVQWVGPNGLGMNATQTASGVGGEPQGQRLMFIGNGTGTSTFTASDISTITTNIASDLSAQMNANITRVQNFSSGGG